MAAPITAEPPRAEPPTTLNVAGSYERVDEARWKTLWDARDAGVSTDRLVFPQADMLPAADVARIAGLLDRGAPEPEIDSTRKQ